jgi:death-on-curing protein
LSAIAWLDVDDVLALHERVIDAFGGSHGLLNRSLLESALDRPRNRAAYDDAADLFDLAAAYTVGLARNHAFIDGNKRSALLTAEVFLGLNGYQLEFASEDAVETMVDVARGALDEPALAAWFRRRALPVRP